MNNLVPLATSGLCGAPGRDDRLCATTNVVNSVNPAWKTWDKDTGSLDQIAAQQFYEGAINVTAFGLDPCISTLLTNTRSSVETSATLYDYARVPFRVCAGKSGTKFHDVNANGVRDAGEPALEGWTINLYQDTETIGSYDGGPVFKTAATDAAGLYSFADLVNGNYIVCEALQAGWSQSAPTSAPTGETLVTNCPGSTNGYAFATTGANLANNDFGNFQNATKSGTKFVDINANSVQTRASPDWRASRSTCSARAGRAPRSTSTTRRTSTGTTRSRCRRATTRCAKRFRPVTRSPSRPRERTVRSTAAGSGMRSP